VLHPGSEAGPRPEGDVETRAPQYGPDVPGGSRPEWSQTDQMRALVPPLALGIAVVAAVTDPASAIDLILPALAVAAFAAWAYLRRVPLPALALLVLIPSVAAQRGGELEPLMFEASLLALVVGAWASTLGEAIALGLLALTAPVAVSLVQEPSEVVVGIWIMGIAFPWVIARAIARQRQLAIQLHATRRELAEQAVLAERRRVARDVHDFVGHGLAAVMLQVTSARHVLRRDPAAAEEALRSAEEVGRRSMQELRRTVALLRSDDDTGRAAPLPSAADISALVEDARAAGLEVELRTQGDLSGVAPTVGVALYRIAQEALANAARHAPRARTILGIEVGEGEAHLLVETSGPTVPVSANEAGRPRYGLVGMRERATALGGELTAGPTPEGWRLSCRLPLEAPEGLPAGEARIP
jgi:signal transduction histidine kinase